MQFVEAYNKHDAAAAAAFYTEDAIRTFDRGASETYSGRKAIEKNFAEFFAASPQPAVGKLVQMYAIEDRIVAISEYSIPGVIRGHTVKIYVRDADTWKIRWEFITTAHSPR
jgi:ketosteroid isomerase-like protein